MGEHRDCTVKAIALACNVPYATAHAALKAAGRKERQGTYRPQQVKAIEALGYKVTCWPFMVRQNLIKSYPGVHGRVLKNITTHHPRRFPQVWSQFNDRTLLLHSRGHVAAFKNGVVHDWSINKALQVHEIWEITKA